MFVERWATLEALPADFAVPGSRGLVKAVAALASAPPLMSIYEAKAVAPRSVNAT